jgi:hypothetical protein
MTTANFYYLDVSSDEADYLGIEVYEDRRKWSFDKMSKFTLTVLDGKTAEVFKSKVASIYQDWLYLKYVVNLSRLESVVCN